MQQQQVTQPVITTLYLCPECGHWQSNSGFVEAIAQIIGTIKRVCPNDNAELIGVKPEDRLALRLLAGVGENETYRFALATPQAHIAIVERERSDVSREFQSAKQQLSGHIARVFPAEHKIRLTNGTVVYFFAAAACERLRGLQLDRIDVASGTVSMLPEWFLESRLKPGIDPVQGIVYR
jgi:hypothetical protein